MKYVMACLVSGVLSIAAGHAIADRPIDQSTIVSVKPAIPEGARKFVQQQNQPPKKPLFDGWFGKKASQPPGYITSAPPARPAGGKSFWDIFNPAKWGKGKPAPNANQQQLQQRLQQDQLPSLNQQGSGQPGTWNVQGSGSTPGQMPPANVTAPASQP